MNGHDFLRLASKLAASSREDEANNRTAVSRAYYGAFHLAKGFLQELGIHVAGHGQPHQFLSMAGNPHAATAAMLLVNLQSARVNADYHLDRINAGSTHFAKQHVEMALDFVQELDRCRDEEARTGICENIKNHLKKRGGAT